MAQPLDLTTLEDDVLDNMRRTILAEQERRQRCAQLPEQITSMVRAALASGVTPDTISDAVTAGAPAKPTTPSKATTPAEQETTSEQEGEA